MTTERGLLLPLLLYRQVTIIPQPLASALLVIVVVVVVIVVVASGPTSPRLALPSRPPTSHLGWLL
jgi:hypothetical protein